MILLIVHLMDGVILFRKWAHVKLIQINERLNYFGGLNSHLYLIDKIQSGKTIFYLKKFDWKVKKKLYFQ